MDVFMLGLFLVCFGSVTLLVLWCDKAALRKGR